MEKPKIIAFYLPQFHAIPENDKWWGVGFTEWTNTKKAKPLFDGHVQPKTPLNDNYYNLLDVNIQRWQAELAKDYGVYGFCYYHYWFNGKLLLEKPMENMLRNKDIDLPFCISWANEPWARAWDGKENEVLMPQEYGDENDWKSHFNYLLKFFKDDRYIKIDSKPLMLIYRTNNIDRCDEMVKFWDDMAKENEFNGIYIVETLNSFQSSSCIENSNAVVEFEPMLTMRHHLPIFKQIQRYVRKKMGRLDLINYDYVWSKIAKRNINYGKNKFLGAFVSWDNTARKGKRGLVIDKANPDKFYKYLKSQVDKAIRERSEFLFLNAWNEWAEGTYLEPDKLRKLSMLKAVKKVVLEDGINGSGEN